jgi:hypothetical protein
MDGEEFSHQNCSSSIILTADGQDYSFSERFPFTVGHPQDPEIKALVEQRLKFQLHDLMTNEMKQ